MSGFRSFPVRLPSGIRYWTVIDEGLRPVVEVDEFLLHARLGRDLAESTTRAYATGIGLFLDWCARTGVPWREAAGSLGRFVYWLQHYAPELEGWVLGEPVRGARRVNGVLAAVREFLKHAVSVGELDAGVLDALFEVCYDVDLPAEVRGESNARMRARARHRLREPETVVDALSEQDALGLLRACRSARDRFIVLTLWRMGLRRGELTGVRREDVHFVPDASPLGCPIRGAHLHVIKRDNGNGAAAKSRRARAVPADWLVVQAYDQYMIERDGCVAAADCDYVLSG